MFSPKKIESKIHCPLFLSFTERNQLKSSLSRSLPQTIRLSFNLGISQDNINITQDKKILLVKDKIPLPPEKMLSADLRTILKYDGQSWSKWQYFDNRNQKYYKMIFINNKKPPTVEISGIKMHITRNGDPEQDTQNKIKQFRHLEGKILDTCTGLGYTAIAAAKFPEVNQVYTCEVDINMIRLCRENPWSQGLFHHGKIHLILTPIQNLVQKIPTNNIDYIIHDPPRFTLAGELYSENFYRNLYRILKTNGEIYHYTGDPNKRSRRFPLKKEIQKLFDKLGFTKTRQVYFGIWAKK